ncbi:hybrid sensor histidine kinase/response regulator [Pseudomonas mangiferae]|uniref:histidine kinase n=1 Tax=Pseudomonas mangiferae TaxID=2593654 RepID=A0A553H4G6_9PSED|nr:response regulator [Pseudomonas mangiferae]TRX76638.1 response regulator [Pseudomonas mangiferae]
MTDRKRIAIIDDTVANRYVLKKILGSQRDAYDVVEAGTGREGLDLIDHDTDLMIVDVNLPDMTGFELVQALESRLGKGNLPPVINISATFVSGKDKAMGLTSGAQAYLTHPINPDEVLATIALLLESSTRFGHLEHQRNAAVARSENLETEKIMLERFMRSLSHDLRSPLTAATMVVKLMKKKPERRNEEMLQILDENLVRMAQMITNVLDISHVSLGGSVPLRGEKHELHGLLREAVENLRLQVENEIRLDEEPGEQLVYWDKQAFLRILDNVVVNAAKHGAPQCPITVGQRRDQEQIVISVSNEGRMPDDVLANLATPYFISSRSDTQGWGLGLPIVKALSESFGGHTVFGNQEGRVRVDIYLPVALGNP